MGIFIALLVALGFAGLAVAVYKGSQALSRGAAASTGGVNAAANRIEKEGILSSLFPKGLFSGGGPQKPGTPNGAENPANWGQLFTGLGNLGKGIAPLFGGSSQGNSGGSSSPPEQIDMVEVGPSNLDDYKRRLLGDGGTSPAGEYNPD